jgi:hypothetical protein
VQEEPREGNGDRWERRPVADQPHDHAPTPPARDNNRHANEGENVDAIANADACRSLGGHRRTFAAAAMLLRGCPEAATSEERRVCQQLKALLEAAGQQAESSASRQHLEHGRARASSTHGPNLPPS